MFIIRFSVMFRDVPVTIAKIINIKIIDWLYLISYLEKLEGLHHHSAKHFEISNL